MNENPILPARIFFFPPLIYPKIGARGGGRGRRPSYLTPTSPLLPTTYQPLPPHSIARAPGSRDVEREQTWSLEWLGAGTSLELGAARAGPMQDLGKYFLKITMFIFFTHVSVLLQRKLQAPELACCVAGACVTQAPELRSFSRVSELRCCKLEASELLRSFLAALQQVSSSRASPESACCVLGVSGKVLKRRYRKCLLVRCIYACHYPCNKFNIQAM
jgi:hypothetical protein